jgi:hypothetical protein
MELRSRLVTGLLVLGLVGSGGGAVLAASSGGTSTGSAAKEQYCPPSSPGAGKLKDMLQPGNKCGQCPPSALAKKDKKCCDPNAADKKKCPKP